VEAREGDGFFVLGKKRVFGGDLLSALKDGCGQCWLVFAMDCQIHTSPPQLIEQMKAVFHFFDAKECVKGILAGCGLCWIATRMQNRRLSGPLFEEIGRLFEL
jgi:hypothetical protein